MSGFADEVGVRIADVREAAGLSKADLARRLHVSRATVTRWESGVRGVSLTDLPRVAAGLGISLLQLLGPACAGWDARVRAAAPIEFKTSGGSNA